MTGAARKVTAGHVGRPHGLDGSFYVDRPSEDLTEGRDVVVAGQSAVVERRAGTDARPIVRLSGIDDRDAAGGLRGEPLIVDGGDLDEGEYLIADLVGCQVPGLGTVRRVIPGPSCDVLEVGDEAILVPFVSDAVKRVAPDQGLIEVDRRFLGLDAEQA